MRVAFVKPPVGGILGLEMLTFVEHLGPICVAACLEVEGHTAAVFDLRIEGEEQGLESCRTFNPDIVVFEWKGGLIDDSIFRSTFEPGLCHT